MAILVGLYHGQNCFAEHIVISGGAGNEFITADWEYLPSHGGGGTGEILICLHSAHPFLEDGEHIFLDGLIPEGATVTGGHDLWNKIPLDYSLVTCNGDFDDVPDGCEDNQATEDVLVTDYTICFDISLQLSPELTYGAAESPLVHGIVCGTVGDGTCMSASPCLAPPLGCVSDFVTVIPIQAPCIQDGDFDHDGDVDLLDFSMFQQLFTGPK